MEAVAPIDAEALAIEYLKARFASRSEVATVATKWPVVRPDRMVKVTGVDILEQTEVHFYHRLIFECYAESEIGASDLCRTTYALVKALEGDDSASHWVAEVVTVGGPTNFPDPDVGDRYQFTVDILTSGAVI
jgi:hypothetical protein